MEHQEFHRWAERVRDLMTLAQCGSVSDLESGYASYLTALGGGGRAREEHTIVEAILETCDAEKQNGIHVAALSGNLTAMEWFASNIDRDILVNVKTKNGTTPLMFAVKGNQFEMVKLLISWGADIYHADQARLTSIHLALTIENDSRILDLLTQNLQPHENLYNPATVTGSLLTWTVLTNNIILFKKLVDISEPRRLAEDCFNSTLPCAVVASAHVETAGVVLHYLSAKGVAPNAIAGAHDQQGCNVLGNLAQLEDSTLLARLIEGCTPDCVRELCQKPGEGGKLPIQLAATESAREILAQYTEENSTTTETTTLEPLSEPDVENFSLENIAEAEQLKLKGNSLFCEKSYTEAENAFDQACSLFNVELLAANSISIPEDARGLIATITANLSVTCLRLQNYQKAEQNARFAIKFAPDWYKGYYRLGMVLKAQGDFAEATQQMYECVLRNSTDESLKREFTNCLEKAKAQHASK